ncbi:MAG TPA: PA2779 family protein [Dissulfurispiraceae bacterium]|nr:PA2779 family protein [Dissulfurispiraceae bacterium]
MRVPFMKQVAWYLVIAMFVIGIAPRVDAGLAPSEVIALAQTDRQADLASIQKVLESKMIRERLEQYGLTQSEVEARLSQMSDQQIHNFALQLDDMKVGGDGALGIIIALLVIAILVIVIINLTGHRVVVR